MDETVEFILGFFAWVVIAALVVFGAISLLNWGDGVNERNESRKCELLAGNGGYGDWRFVRNNIFDYTCFVMVEPGKYVPSEQLREYGGEE